MKKAEVCEILLRFTLVNMSKNAILMSKLTKFKANRLNQITGKKNTQSLLAFLHISEIYLNR